MRESASLPSKKSLRQYPQEQSMECHRLLIFSQDSSLTGVVRVALQDLGVAGSYFDTDSTRALEALRSRHFDGIIVDCNDMACAKQILTRIRRGTSNRQTPVIAIVNDATDMRAMQTAGANERNAATS
jgi:DNA-binding response OmpR family regulator